MMLELLLTLSAVAGIDAAPAQLRVASYNAWLLPLASDDFYDRRDAMPAALEPLEPDVLCLQEVWDRLSMDVLRVSLARQLPHAVEGGGGLALLSRWPVADSHFTAFPAHESLSFAERIAKKGWIDAVVTTPSGHVRFIVTHLAHVRGDRAPHRLQLETLAAALHGDRRLPTVICGDLNFRGIRAGVPTAELQRLLEIGFKDPAAQPRDVTGLARSRPPTRHGWPRRAGRRRGWDPDYILYRPGSGSRLRHLSFRQALDTPDTALSDHNLLLVDFLLE